MGVRCGGGRGPASLSAPFIFAPFACGKAPGSEELPSGLDGVDDEVKSLSSTICGSFSEATDMADSLRSSSGGRFSGCELVSYLWLLDRGVAFVGEEGFERRECCESVRWCRAFSFALGTDFFSGEALREEVGESCWESSGSALLFFFVFANGFRSGIEALSFLRGGLIAVVVPS